VTGPRVTRGEDRVRCVGCGKVPDVAIPFRGKAGICEPCARRAVGMFERYAAEAAAFRRAQQAKAEALS
jgi:hypothetical protein